MPTGEVAVEAAVAALTAAGITVSMPPSDSAVDLVADIGGVPLALQIKAAATVTPESLARQLGSRAGRRDPGTYAQLLVADRIIEAARHLLVERGLSWLDLRGHLHLSGPGVLVDTSVPGAGQPTGGPSPQPLSHAVSREVACELLMKPASSVSVRRIARRLGRAPSSVSVALRDLRAAHLVGADGTPAVPELFWEVAARWRTVAGHVARLPTDPAVANALATGWGEPLNDTGWALTDVLAAAEYEAPVGVRTDYPPDFYVPDRMVFDRAMILLGSPMSVESRAATIRIALVPRVCRERIPGYRWPLAHPLFVALDLARDPGRGREILDGWQPPEGVIRVW